MISWGLSKGENFREAAENIRPQQSHCRGQGFESPQLHQDSRISTSFTAKRWFGPSISPSRRRAQTRTNEHVRTLFRPSGRLHNCFLFPNTKAAPAGRLAGRLCCWRQTDDRRGSNESLFFGDRPLFDDAYFGSAPTPATAHNRLYARVRHDGAGRLRMRLASPSPSGSAPRRSADSRRQARRPEWVYRQRKRAAPPTAPDHSDGCGPWGPHGWELPSDDRQLPADTGLSPKGSPKSLPGGLRA